MNFESPGTQRFNENYAHIYDTTPYQPTQPQPTQEISQDMMWIQQTNEFVNSTWAAVPNSTHAHGGQGSSSAAVPNNPPTRVHNFFELELTRPQVEEDQQQYGRGHRQGFPPLCGTGSHRVRPGDGDQH
ncbi:hypothetical protein QL285_052385 [Trifolium repens]|nr:hypothetical protein QL285_052385 [Trifolium repens]